MDASPGIPPGATDAELKLRALSGPDGNFWTFAGSWFVLSLVVNAAGSATCGIGSLVLAAPAAFGLANLSLRAADHRRLDFADGFTGFNDFGRALAWWCLVTLYVSLWSLLLVVPGIVKAFSYAMSPFLLVDHPEMGAAESIDESRRLMDGNKWRLFVLCLRPPRRTAPDSRHARLARRRAGVRDPPAARNRRAFLPRSGGDVRLPALPGLRALGLEVPRLRHGARAPRRAPRALRRGGAFQRRAARRARAPRALRRPPAPRAPSRLRLDRPRPRPRLGRRAEPPRNVASGDAASPRPRLHCRAFGYAFLPWLATAFILALRASWSPR